MLSEPQTFRKRFPLWMREETPFFSQTQREGGRAPRCSGASQSAPGVAGPPSTAGPPHSRVSARETGVAPTGLTEASPSSGSWLWLKPRSIRLHGPALGGFRRQKSASAGKLSEHICPPSMAPTEQCVRVAALRASDLRALTGCTGETRPSHREVLARKPKACLERQQQGTLSGPLPSASSRASVRAVRHSLDRP